MSALGDPTKLTVKMLKKELEARGLATKGRKAELAERLTSALANTDGDEQTEAAAKSTTKKRRALASVDANVDVAGVATSKNVAGGAKSKNVSFSPLAPGSGASSSSSSRSSVGSSGGKGGKGAKRRKASGGGTSKATKRLNLTKHRKASAEYRMYQGITQILSAHVSL